MTLVFILGPTASGKTSLSVELAKKLNGEIVGADSVQIYKDLVIGSAAPTREEMQGISHHLIGTMDLKDEISAGIYISSALPIIEKIERSGKTPIVVGGTNFYVDALINGLSPVPAANEETMRLWEEKFSTVSTEELFSKLCEVDPEWAACISSPNDRQRIKRGLFVAKTTGRTLSEWNRMERINAYQGDFIALGIDIPREQLYERINLRTKIMLESGLVEEVRAINEKGFNSSNCKALCSIGYAETERYLKGEIALVEELQELIAQNTRHLAKRQLTWLRNRDYVVWKKPEEILDVSGNVSTTGKYVD
ncbi:tRNA (adenosine(37)-N6)-dimethylallyltransferase MiaA [bacterium]|nr:tRNA (adenosine(37)-N6)-dimethylallyltransferase MiaA [bacterium]